MVSNKKPPKAVFCVALVSNLFGKFHHIFVQLLGFFLRQNQPGRILHPESQQGNLFLGQELRNSPDVGTLPENKFRSPYTHKRAYFGNNPVQKRDCRFIV
jgi:hypothetical protein